MGGGGYGEADIFSEKSTYYSDGHFPGLSLEVAEGDTAWFTYPI